jgi:hypothetical protein
MNENKPKWNVGRIAKIDSKVETVGSTTIVATCEGVQVTTKIYPGRCWVSVGEDVQVFSSVADAADGYECPKIKLCIGVSNLLTDDKFKSDEVSA